MELNTIIGMGLLLLGAICGGCFGLQQKRNDCVRPAIQPCDFAVVSPPARAALPVRR